MGLFLQGIGLKPPAGNCGSHPFNIPAFQAGFDIDIISPFVIFSGENGAGKSTLLSAIAHRCGFNPSGGNQHHFFGTEGSSPLADLVTLRWSKKVRRGFYLRADRLADFQRYLESLSESDLTIFANYGGTNLSDKSHGEGIFALYQHHFRDGVFLLDEPETALSFSRQIALVSILKTLAKDHGAQFIMATHSPVLMSFPEAQIVSLDATGAQCCDFEETEIYKTSKLFFDAPERFHKHL